jgi:hypothetical protein
MARTDAPATLDREWRFRPERISFEYRRIERGCREILEAR